MLLTLKPSLMRRRGQVYLAQIEGLNVQVTALDQRVKGASKETEAARRTQTLPGVARSSRLYIGLHNPQNSTRPTLADWQPIACARSHKDSLSGLSAVRKTQE
jgi:hypothetical protein